MYGIEQRVTRELAAQIIDQLFGFRDVTDLCQNSCCRHASTLVSTAAKGFRGFLPSSGGIAVCSIAYGLIGKHYGSELFHAAPICSRPSLLPSVSGCLDSPKRMLSIGHANQQERFVGRSRRT